MSNRKTLRPSSTTSSALGGQSRKRSACPFQIPSLPKSHSTLPSLPRRSSFGAGELAHPSTPFSSSTSQATPTSSPLHHVKPPQPPKPSEPLTSSITTTLKYSRRLKRRPVVRSSTDTTPLASPAASRRFQNSSRNPEASSASLCPSRPETSLT